MSNKFVLKPGCCLGFFDGKKKECIACNLKKACKVGTNSKKISADIKSVVKTTEDKIKECLEIINDKNKRVSLS